MGFDFFGSDEGGWGATYEHDDYAPELLACPFCGRPAAEICNTHSPAYWVKCNFCDAEGPGSDTWDGWTPESRERCEQLHRAALADAVEQWNTRFEE